MHVRLRQQALPIPGSPFKLTVLPGPAHAKSTSLSRELLVGMVGTDAGTVELRAAGGVWELLGSCGAHKSPLMLTLFIERVS